MENCEALHEITDLVHEILSVCPPIVTIVTNNCGVGLAVKMECIVTIEINKNVVNLTGSYLITMQLIGISINVIKETLMETQIM